MRAEESIKKANVDLEGRVEERTAELLKVNVELRKEVEERRQAEDALRVSLRFLEIVHEHTDIDSLLREYVSEIKDYTGCDAVGIRVLDENGNIPYQAYQGFGQKFYELESPLSLRSDECMCINVIRGDVDPNLPFYTEGGGFCVNAASRFLATVSDEEKGRTRNRCNMEGYETVALFPFRSGGEIFGLIHVADHRENMILQNVVKVLEKAAMQLGTAFQRARMESKLVESQEHYRSLFNNMLNGFAYCRMLFEQDRPRDFIYLDVNDAFETLTGLKEVVGKKVSEVIPGIQESDPELIEIYGRVALTGNPERIETFVEGLGMWFSISVYSPQKEHFCAVFDVITERKRAEEEILRLNRLYDLLSQVNQSVVRVQAREEFLPEVCRLIVERGAIDLAWIGLLDPASRRINPVAYFGNHHEILSHAGFYADERSEWQGNPGKAILEGQSFYCNKCSSDACLYPSEKAPRQFGFQSCGSFPLRFQGQVCGVLNVCVSESDFLGKREIELLEEVAKAASFALDKIEGDIQRERLNKQLQQQATFLQTLMEAMPYPVFYKDTQLQYLGCNNAFEQFVGAKKDQIIGKSSDDIWPHELADTLCYADQELLASKSQVRVIEGTLLDANGVRVDFLSRKATFADQGGNVGGIIGALVDITERKRAEELVRIRLSLLEFATSHSLDELLRKTVDEVCALTRSFIGFYHFVESDGKTLFLMAWSTRTVEEFCKAEGKGPHYNLNEAGVWADCIRERKPVIHNDYSALSHRKGLPEGHTPVIRELVVPIMRSDRIVAVLGIGNKPTDYNDKDLEVVSYLADVAWEITEHKRAEQALLKSEERLILALAAGRMGVWDWDVTTNDVFWSPECCNIFGMESFDGKLKSFIELIHPEDRDRVWLRIKQALEERTIYNDEFRIILPGGNVRWVSGLGQAEYDINGKPLRLIGNTKDITKRKQTEESLSLSEDRYRRLFEDAVLGIFRTTPGGQIINVNPAFARMFGFDSPKETKSLVNDVAFDLYVDPSRRNAIVSMILNARGPIHIENLYRRKDGGIFTGNLHAWAVRDREGKPLYLEGFIEDITERKRAEEEKETLERQLRQAQKVEAIGTLAGGIAHDFNNILQPILGYTEMGLNELSPSDPRRDGLEQVLNASLRAKELVGQILAVSRSTQEQQRMPIDISSIIKEALKLLRSSLPTSIEIRQDIRKSVALADSTQIHQVLMNLCTNAAHAMGEEGILEVGLIHVDLSETDLADQSIVDLKPGPHLKLSVSDTGVGMDARTMERIFDPYFTTKEVGKGSGLGLAVVSGIVKRHNGAITVLSEPGKGTTFSVYISRIETATEIPIETPHEAPRGAESILLLDDEQAVVKMGSAILKRLGYKVTIETDSLRALEVFSAGPDEFDLIITDYAMPNLTGIALAREIRRIRPDMPILLCTGYSEKITSDSVRELGIELLLKPYRLRQVSEAVRKILDAQKGKCSEA